MIQKRVVRPDAKNVRAVDARRGRRGRRADFRTGLSGGGDRRESGEHARGEKRGDTGRQDGSVQSFHDFPYYDSKRRESVTEHLFYFGAAKAQTQNSPSPNEGPGEDKNSH